MDNLMSMRIMLTIVLLLGSALAIIAAVFWSFPLNVVGVVIAVLSIIGAVYFSMKAEKKARFDAFYAAIEPFGTPLSFDNYSAAFEKDGTRFEITYPQGENESSLKINFFLSNFRERFIIQHQEIFMKSLPGCNFLQNSPLAPDVHLQAQNLEFLWRFVQIPAIRNEIYEYPATMFGRFRITFDDGNFELEWTPKFSEQTDGVYKICKTAVVFHDELKKTR